MSTVVARNVAAHRVAIVTGGSSGIGLETVRGLAKAGYHVISACRDVKKGNKTVHGLQEETPGLSIEVRELDLSSLASVYRFCQGLQLQHLDVLVNNAGQYLDKFELSKDGYEMMFAVNHLAHFYLTLLLLPYLVAAANGRVVFVGSNAHGFWHRLVPGTLMDGGAHERYSGARAGFKYYGRSKLCINLFSAELGRRLRLMGTNVSTYAVHPGAVKTNLGSLESRSHVLKIAVKPAHLFFHSAAEGASTSLFCALSPQVGGMTGLYWAKSAPISPKPQALDHQAAVMLWEVDMALIRSRGLPCPNYVPNFL